jgi:hypothetical protein
MEIRDLEERDREGYQTWPQTDYELARWESEAVWPADSLTYAEGPPPPPHGSDSTGYQA